MKRLSTIYLLFFTALAWAIYWKTRSAGFVTDWFGWEYKYKAGNFLDVFQSFGYKGMHPVLHFFNYSMYSVFGKSEMAWYLVFATIHALNAWLAGSLYLRLARGASQNSLAGLGVGLLVLLSPYAAEVVVWRVCLHYLLVLAFSLLSIHALIDYLEEKRTKSLVLVHLFFLLGLFSLEWTLVLPGILGVILAWRQLVNRQFEWKPWVYITAIQAALIAGWFGLNKLVLGQVIGHYGAATHLKFEPVAALATMWKYFLKYALCLRYWHHPLKERIFGAMDQPAIAIGLTVAVFALAGYSILRWKQNNRSQLIDLCAALLCFFIALLPVCNLFFYFLDYNENDRYGYFAAPFFMIAAMFLITKLPNFFQNVLMLAALSISLMMLTKTTRYWHEADKQYRSFIQDFHYYDHDEALILALPDNYHGIYMFRIIGGESAFKEALELYTGKPFKGRMAEVALYNAESQMDAVRVNKPDSTGQNYHMSFVHNGSWWWWNGIGASDRETDWFRFVKKEWHSEVSVKTPANNRVVLYPEQGKFRVVE
jgi:hypothetical protein